MRAMNRTKARGFSLIELVIVVVIIGIIGAIAIPRMSRGAAGAADSALTANLSVLRGAIDLYAIEHIGKYPAVANIASQLTQFSDSAGNTNAAKTPLFTYGPYLRSVPGLPVDGIGAASGQQGDNGIAAAPAAGVGWIYVAGKGAINASTGNATDDTGKAYSSY